MTQESESRFAIIATLLAFALVGGVSLLLWALTGRVDRAVQLQSISELTLDESLPASVRSKVSAGNKALFADESEKKAEGIAAIADGNYASAVTAFNASLSENPNDPESVIYRNNARIGNEAALTIAVVAPAGAQSAIVLEILRGVAQAQDDINRSGGIDGMPVQLLLVDDDNDPETAKTLASGLISNPAILGVIGHYSSDVTLATVPIYEQGELVAITPVSTAVDLSGISPYLYRTVPADSFAAAALAAYMIYYREDRTAAVVYDSASELSGSLKTEFNSFISAWGGEVIAEYDVANGFSAEAIAETEADVLMLAASPDTLAQSAQIIQANGNAKPILGGDEIYNRYILEETGENARALTVAVPWHLLSGDTDIDFVESSRALWEGDVSWRTATAYDAMRAIAAGLSVDPSREGLKAALDNTDFSVDSATGPLVFLPSGDRRQVDRLVQVEAGTRSGTGYDFVPFILD